MADTKFETRLATREDVGALKTVMDLAIGELLKGFLDVRQIAASRTIMGLDTQLIEDGTYFVVLDGGVIAGCGGWSRRATTHGGDHSPGRDDARPRSSGDGHCDACAPCHASRLQAPRCRQADPFTLRGGRQGRRLFARVELVATLAGAPLYRACGYRVTQDFLDESGGAAVPLFRMSRAGSIDRYGAAVSSFDRRPRTTCRRREPFWSRRGTTPTTPCSAPSG